MSTPEQPDLFGYVDQGPSDTISLAQSDDNQRHHWPQMLLDMRAVIEDAAKRDGYGEDEASKIARQAVLALAEYAGGRQIYIPVGAKLRRAIRDAEIWSRFKGDNIDALAREYRLTRTSIYDILNNQRELHRNRQR